MEPTPEPHDSGNPFQSPATVVPEDVTSQVPAGTSPGAQTRFGNQINRAFNCYLAQWSNWIVPLLLCGVIAVVCYLACVLPFLLAQGPLACGLYMCAFRNLRGWAVESSALNRGWEMVGSAILAGLALMFLQAAPLLLLAAVGLGAYAVFAYINRGAPVNADEAAPWIMAIVFVVEIVFVFGMMAWTLWINARTMFVMPLVADRGYDFATAIGESWRATRVRLLERLLVSFLAMIIGMMGIYFCYVGLLFTLPLQFLIIAAAYDDEFGIASVRPANKAAKTPESSMQTSMG